MAKVDQLGRAGFDEMEEQINASPEKCLGGCWLPSTTGSDCRELIHWLVTWFNVRNVLDFCAGGGEASRCFRTLGCTVVALEGLQYASSRVGLPCLRHNMETGPVIFDNLDLTFSVEGVEHIGNTEATLTTICQSKVLAFSHAIPIQGGHHHVACYEDAWWIENVEKRGYTYFPKLTEIARRFDGSYFSQSGLVFVRDTNLNDYGLLRCDYV